MSECSACGAIERNVDRSITHYDNCPLKRIADALEGISQKGGTE